MIKTKAYAQEVHDMIALMREIAQQEILPKFGNVTEAQAIYKKSCIDIKDYATEVDNNVSKFILDRVRSSFPGSYSEEHKYPDRFDHDLIWQLDPIDGTQEFCENYAEGYSCLAALLKKQPNNDFITVAGIIYRPAIDEFWYYDGADVTWLKNGTEQLLPTYTRDNLICWQRKVDNFNHLDDIYKTIAEKLNLPYTIEQRGAAGSSVADLLSGKLNLVILNSNVTKDWDIAASVSMVKALGGFICDFDGNDFTSFNRKDSNGFDEPYNLRGYVISIAFKKEEIIPDIPKVAFDDLLHCP